MSQRDGFRDRAGRHLRGARLAFGLLAVVLVVPWSLGELQDARDEGDRDYFLFGAHTVLNADEASNGQSYGALGYALGVLVAACWVGVLLGVLGTLGGVLASERIGLGVARGTHFVAFANLAMLLWAGILYVLAWIYMWRPAEDVERFQPGYAPILALPLLVLWGLSQVNLVRLLFGGSKGSLRATKPVSFD